MNFTCLQQQMFKSALYLFAILLLSASISVNTLTKESLQSLRLYPDYKHHFIFFHQPTLDAAQPRMEALADSDIKLHINDCARNPLPECQHPQHEPVVLLFNRIIIRFNGDPTSVDDIIEWAERRIFSSPKYISSREELDSYLATTPNSFCFCQPASQIEESGYFYVLSKSLPHQKYCILNNIVTITELGLKQNNVTLFLDNANNRREYEHPNRFQSWEWFVKANMFHTLPRVPAIVGERFAQKQKNLQIFILACDFSLKCDRVWEQLHKVEEQLNSEKLGQQFYVALLDQKESLGFNLYYHFTFQANKLPALAHIDLKSSGDAGTLIRHRQYISSFSLQTLDQFITNVQKGAVEPLTVSAPLPKNNGFYGKGSQKFVQKLVGSSAQSVVAASQNHYVLLVTALQIQCEPCENFYKQFKQIASLLVEKDVTFGILNANLNQVPFKHVTQLPQVLLFKKDDKEHPIRLNVNHSFDHLMLFFKNNLGSQYSDPNEL